MTKSQAKKRINKLKKEIHHHRYLYHVLDKQEISDAALDSLKHELLNLEKQYPDLITPSSPTQRVGGKPLNKFSKVRHLEPILSIEDIFNFEELKDWKKYMQDYLLKHTQPFNKLNLLKGFDYFCERKIDGIDIVLTYKKGILITGATRGNGKIGENVTQNIKTIEAIPLRLERDIDVVVQGEVFMRNNDFKKLNQTQKQAGKSVFSNPRNVVAGSIRQLDSSITASRPLDCYVFEIITNIGQKTHKQVHDLLKELGFKTDSKTQYCKNIQEVETYYKKWQKKRKIQPFNYDGIVVLANNIEVEKHLGAVGKSPRWMRAYKFPGQQATTVVQDIDIQVGRTGALTPVAKLKPVQIMGTIVSRATLHNEDEIKRLDVRVGDTVIIEKAGDVIPDVVHVLKNMRDRDQKKFSMPRKCPVCNGSVERKKGQAAHYCLNKKCFAIQQRSISHFVSKKGFDIEGLGSKIVSQLINNGLIKDVSDLFTLKIGDLESLERFGEKSAENIITAIEARKNITFSRFLYALGIRHIGEETAELLTKQFQSVDIGCRPTIDGFIKYFQHISLQELQRISDIGPVMAQSIYNWFQYKDNVALLKRLQQHGVRIHHPLVRVAPVQRMAGKIFVFTGALDNMTRTMAKERIRKLGGRVSESISRSTDFIVVGKNPGSKYDKAIKLGVKTIKEKEFITMTK